MKKLSFILLLLMLNIGIVSSQNDTINIDVDLPGFGDKSQNDSKGALTGSNRTNDYNFLKQITTIIRAGKSIQTGFYINNKLWITSNIAKEIQELGDEYKVQFKLINEKEYFKKSISVFTKENYSLAIVKESQIENQIALSNEKNIESADLVLFYVNKETDPFDENTVKMEYIKEKIEWKDGKGKLNTKIPTSNRRVLGGVLIKKYMISKCKDMGCDANKSKKRRKKTSDSNDIFPTGIFQYKVCGVLIKENGGFFISDVPSEIKGFKSNSVDEKEESVEKKEKKKRRSGRRRGRGRRRR